AFAIVFPPNGAKLPVHKGWQMASQEPEDYRDGCNIGILTGRLSGDLVCVDLDLQEAIEQAELLPPTHMIDGRPGKPRAHHWYRVTGIPPALISTAAGGIGGPRIKRFKRASDERSILDFLG